MTCTKCVDDERAILECAKRLHLENCRQLAPGAAWDAEKAWDLAGRVDPTFAGKWMGLARAALVSADARDDPAGVLPAMNWQPIETAPRPAENEPMVPVLLSWTCCRDDGSTMRLVGEGYWHASGGAYGQPDWWWAGTSPGDYYADPISQSITGQITHWMPMPQPPVTDA